MKQLATLFFFALCTFALRAQSPIVFSEIMYNPPESNTDTLEYLELHNTGTAAVNISGYTIFGIVDTIPAGTVLAAGQRYVVAKSASAMNAIFSLTVHQWFSGSLNNSGELIALRDAAGNLVDSLTYSPNLPWDILANGNGQSLELCNSLLDNSLPANWKASTQATGKIVNGKEVKGTPAAANTVACPTPNDTTYATVQNFTFAPADITINVGKTVKWTNNGGFHNIDGSQATYPANPESFGNGSASSLAWTFAKTFNIAGLYTYQCTPHAGSGMVGTVTVLPNSPPASGYTISNIGTVTTNNVTGTADSLNKKFELRGTIYGVNLRASATGLQFVLIDSLNQGITVFNAAKTFGYAPIEKDKIIVRGTIQQFRGLTEIVADTIFLVAANGVLFAPTLTTTLSEATESQLIRIDSLQLVSPSQWASGGAGGFNVDVTNGTQSFKMRIDNDVNIFATSPPVGKFHAIGIGAKNDSITPFDGDYLFLPRYVQDLILIDSTPAVVSYPAYSVAQVTNNNSTGVADSLNVTCELQGTVYGVNLRASVAGLQFTLIDGTKGIGVFSGSKTFGYTVTEKDKIIIRGKIGQFNGFTQINADTIIKISSNNSLVAPISVTVLNENTESNLVKIANPVKLVNPAQWTTGTGAGGFTVQVTDNTNVYSVRIDNDVALYNAPSPGTNNFRLTGLGAQFDNSSPYDAGYQLMPRYAADLEIITATNDPSLAARVKIFPNPVVAELNIKTDIIFTKILITNMLGQQVRIVEWSNLQQTINVADLQQGIYALTFVNENSNYTTTFVKQ